MASVLEDKNKRRETKIKAHVDEKRRMKEEEEKTKKEDLRMRAAAPKADILGNGRNNKQQLPVKPAPRVVAPVSKPHVSQAPRAPYATATHTTPLPAAASAPMPTNSTTRASTVPPTHGVWRQVTPVSTKADTTADAAAAPLPVASGKSLPLCKDASISFLVGGIVVKTPATVVKTPATAVETPATTVVETQAAPTVAMTYATALQKQKAAYTQKSQGPINVAATATSVPESKKTTTVTTQTNQPAAKETVVLSETKTTTSPVPSEKNYHSGYQRTTNGAFQKYRATNGGGNGSSQKYNGNERRFAYGQRYNGNGRFNNGGGQDKQKTQARPKPVVDDEGWQKVEYRSGRRN